MRFRSSMRFVIFLLLLITAQTACVVFNHQGRENAWASAFHSNPPPVPEKPQDSVQILNATFLGGAQRNFYGEKTDSSFQLVWKALLGSGKTIVSRETGAEEWYGAGWTGQPLVVREGKKVFLIQGCYDHHLKKFDAETGKLIWQYAFDDILKGTGTLWKDTAATDPLNRILVLQGSRIGNQNSIASAEVYSYRAVSYFTGKEIWRMNIKRGPSYSRDVDASAIIVNDTAYNGLENGSFVAFDPRNTEKHDSVNHPKIFQELALYAQTDAARHGGNLVTESSPALLGDHIYIAAGSGHIYGYNLRSKKIDWDFFIGSDIDGSPVVTSDSCIIVTVEKQYINGHGGVFKLDPRKAPAQSVCWYYPTGDRDFADWKGGVIGSAAINDKYAKPGNPLLAAFTGIDGKLVVVNHQKIRRDTTVTGPDGTTQYPAPELFWKTETGPSISTPIFTSSHIVAAGYNGIRLFAYDSLHVEQLAEQPGIFESTPVAHNGKIFVASRDGYLYCFGDPDSHDTTKLSSVVSAQVTMQTSVPAMQHAKANVIAAKKDSGFLVGRDTLFGKHGTESGDKIATSPQAAAQTRAITGQRIFKTAIKGKKGEDMTSSSPVVVKTNPGNSAAGYYLIVGAFRDKGNAERSLQSWKAKGYAAELVVSSGDLNFVSAAYATAEAGLLSAKAGLPEKIKTQAWVLHKN